MLEHIQMQNKLIYEIQNGAKETERRLTYEINQLKTNLDQVMKRIQISDHDQSQTFFSNTQDEGFLQDTAMLHSQVLKQEGKNNHINDSKQNHKTLYQQKSNMKDKTHPEEIITSVSEKPQIDEGLMEIQMKTAGHDTTNVKHSNTLAWNKEISAEASESNATKSTATKPNDNEVQLPAIENHKETDIVNMLNE